MTSHHKENCLKLAAFINESESFDQTKYFQGFNDFPTSDDCQTPACICGHGTVCFNLPQADRKEGSDPDDPEFIAGPGWTTLQEMEAQVGANLGLDTSDRLALFISVPNFYREDGSFHRRTRRASKAEAVAVLLRFAKTGQVRWITIPEEEE